MKRILIDGYNLLHSKSFHVPRYLDLEGKREHLLRMLQTYAAQNGTQLIIVFDNSQKFAQRFTPKKNIYIIFCNPGQEADEVIKKMVRKEKKRDTLTVVSSDRAIRFSAKDHGVTSLSSEEFCTIMSAGAARPSSPSSQQSVPSKKYDSNIGDDEVRFWMNLFDRDREDE